MKEKIATDLKNNIKDFIEELEVALKFLENTEKERYRILKKNTSISKLEKEFAKRETEKIKNEVNLFKKLLNSYKKSINRIGVDSEEKDIKKILERKRELSFTFRLLLSQHSAMMTNLNWQSPAIKSSLNSRVGQEQDIVKADWNDYKRDRSSDTFRIEQLYSKYIFTNILNSNPVTHLFNSGMAAFTTILYFLICEGIISEGRVLASSSIYVENKMLLDKIFPNKLTLFEYNNEEKIIELIKSNSPKVLFIEPISNTCDLQMFDLNQIIKELCQNYTKELYIVLDTTCSLGFNDFLNDISLPSNIKLILHGSILKAPQLGLERVNSGFIQGYNLGELREKILDYRTLSGTGIQDFSTYLLPITNKELLQRRMKLIARNACILAEAMQKVDLKEVLIDKVIYPSLKSHPDYSVSKKIGFTGFFFNIKFVKKYNYDKFFELFTKEAISLAKKNEIDIVHGASFGFNMTSIYYSVGWDEPDNHYIRISTGTESLYEIEIIKKVLIRAFESTKNKLNL